MTTLAASTQPTEKTSFFKLAKESKSQSFEDYTNYPTARLDKFKLLSGKHQGRTFLDLLENESKYAMWVMTNSKNPKNNIGLFKHYLEKKLEEHDALQLLNEDED